jgi:hypothetical protein
MSDHNIAHAVHQIIIEKAHVQTVADINEFFEDEELLQEGCEARTRCLTLKEVERLP